MVRKIFFVLVLVFGIGHLTNVCLAASNVSCLLDGVKRKDSGFVAAMEGRYVTLSMTCSSNSKYGTMAVVRGRRHLPNSNMDNDVIWLMYPALKCGIGKQSFTKRDILAYAKNHEGASYSNFFSIRHYGNHCDNQKTGCYGVAKAVNSR